jgi:hypothetical protein
LVNETQLEKLTKEATGGLTMFQFFAETPETPEQEKNQSDA